MVYKPNNFYKNLAETTEGKKLWSFLQTTKAELIMEIAVYIRKCPVDVMTPLFLREGYDQTFFHSEMRKMCGSMIKQIMESRCYMHTGSDVSFPRNDLFKSGAKYEKSAQIY